MTDPDPTPTAGSAEETPSKSGCGRPNCRRGGAQPEETGPRTFQPPPIPDPIPVEAAETRPGEYAVRVRYGYMRLQEDFFYHLSDLYPKQGVVVRSERGTEFGEVLLPPRPARAIGLEPHDLPPVLRPAAENDTTTWRRLVNTETAAMQATCQELAESHSLEMKVVCVEHLFGGEKIIFYFRADGRVDFRALVRDLARQYRTRIEMKQIGVRDEAKLLGDVGHCGRELCCNTFLRKLEPVTMRMAKNQKATLDPSKISGVCGRLMCCLRYEDETYRELIRQLPRRGNRVVTRYGEGRVIGVHVLAQRVDVRLDGGKEMELRGELVTRKPRNEESES